MLVNIYTLIIHPDVYIVYEDFWILILLINYLDANMGNYVIIYQPIISFI